MTFIIMGNSLELEQIKIFNSTGEDVTINAAIIQTSESNITIDLSQLNSGIYYLKTKTTSNKVYKQ